MMTAESPKKRTWVPFWRLPDPAAALCPKCNVPMTGNGTKVIEGGLTIQNRRCPQCNATCTTTYRR